MPHDFSGKKVLVTGAGGGIGRSLALRLADLGATVYGVSKTEANLASLKAESPTIVTVQVDLCDWDATRQALAAMPPMDGLVNNAGTSVLDPFLDVKPEDFDRIFASNLKQVLNVSQICGKKMIEAGIHGSIVNVSSAASKGALANHTLYCSSKGALDMMTKVAALELGPHQIRVNAVNPTVALTDMGRMAWSDPAKSKPMLNRIPLGRFAEVDEIVNCILFLLSGDASMVNGATLPVDGGYLAV